MMQLVSRFFRYFVNGFMIVLLVIHFFVKDRIDGLTLIYYSTPLPVLIIFFLMLGIIWLICKRNRFAKYYFALAMGCLLIWSCESFSLASGAPSARSVKLFFWNAARNRSKAQEATGYIRDFHADLIGIVESGIMKKRRPIAEVEKIWRNAFASYTVEILAHGMALIAKGKILAKESGPLGGRGNYNLVKVSLNGERFDVLLVDLDANPSQSRAPAFEPLAKMVRSHSQENLIVMGDFNTPSESILFEPFRPYLNQAYERGGVGFAETWPVPTPVLAIDQIWISKKIKVASCRLNWSRLSDHRSVVATIDLPRSDKWRQ